MVNTMSTSKTFHCIVDDTALITNITEVEAWVLRGAIALVVPLYTLERLHLLKKDTSQIGQNARKAVKFLDEATSNPDARVFIQGPDDQYPSWQQVEAHYTEASARDSQQKGSSNTADAVQEIQVTPKSESGMGSKKAHTADQMPQMVVNKLNISREAHTSPLSTPPLSPVSSGPQSSKTSPEVKSATITASDLSPVPPTLKGLINPVVWYTHERTGAMKNIVLLTNSADTAYLVRDFEVVSKNIHQLRAAIGVEEQEAKNHDKYQKKHNKTAHAQKSSEPKTLFRYQDDESDDEEVVFKPRGRGSNKSASSIRGGNAGPTRGRNHGHSPANSLSGPPQTIQPKPQIPTEEIDPDSFDRGGFGRGSTPLVSIGNHAGNAFGSSNRGQAYRGAHSTGGPSRASNTRGASRGVDRGNPRGRGRLFVP